MADTSQQPEHFLDYWRIVQSRKEIVITVALFVIVVAVAVTLSLPKVYVASTRILVRRDTPDVPLNQQQQGVLNTYDPYFLRTQFEIIQSSPILHEVIRNLRLNELFGRVYNDTGAPFDLQETSKILTRTMKVQQFRDTNLIEIRIFRSSHRTTRKAACEEAARIANEIAAVYRDQRMKVIRDEKRRGLDALNEAFLKQQKKVEDLEKKLEESRKDLDLTVFMTSREGGMASLDKSKIQQLEGDRIAARSHLVDRKTRLEEFNKLSGEELLYSAAYIVKDPALSGLRQQSIDAQVKLRELVEIYGPKHPEVIRAEGVVKDFDKKIKETLIGLKSGLQTEYEISRVTYEALEKDLEDARKVDIQSHSDRYLPFTKLQGDLDRQRQIRDALESRLVQEKIEFDLPRTPVEVIDLAEVPTETDPVSPRLFLNLLLGIIAGLGTGIGLAFFIEYIDTSVKTVEDIEKFINSTILGIIPQKVRALLVEGAESRHAESYRVLRTNIQFSKKMTDGHSLCLTSGGAGEGKSLTACNLAFIYAHAGQKTLLVDADLRRPTQHKMFKVTNAVGFADYLLGKKTAKDLVMKTAVPNLDFIPSGKLPSSSHGLMTVDKLREFIAQIQPDYEMVIFDAPPIMGVSDASILASEVDGVLLVVQHRSYPRAVSGRAKTMIDNVGGNLVGVVLNNININRDYYYYYHSSYYYGTEGSRRERDAEPAAERKA
jgi:succinoglycan biosynthesis transport protein ExoP